MLYKIENFKLFKLPAYAVAQGGSQSYLSYLQVELNQFPEIIWIIIPGEFDAWILL